MNDGDVLGPTIELKVKNRHYVFTGCHRIPERSFFYKGKPLLCYRCLGLNGSFLLLSSVQFLVTLIGLLITGEIYSVLDILDLTFGGRSLGLFFLFSIVLQFPFIIDGSIQAAWDKYESKNPIRFITGFLGGTGQFIFIVVLGAWIGSIFF